MSLITPLISLRKSKTNTFLGVAEALDILVIGMLSLTTVSSLSILVLANTVNISVAKSGLSSRSLASLTKASKPETV